MGAVRRGWDRVCASCDDTTCIALELQLAEFGVAAGTVHSRLRMGYAPRQGRSRMLRPRACTIALPCTHLQADIVVGLKDEHNPAGVLVLVKLV